MAGRISSRDALTWLASAGYLWLAVWSVALTSELGGSAPVLAGLALVSAAGLVVTAYFMARVIWYAKLFDVRLLVVAPAVACGAGLVIAAGGHGGGLLLAVWGALTAAILVYRDIDSWRWLRLPGASEDATRLNLAQTTAVAAAAVPATPKAPRLSPAERAERLVADVRSMTDGQLEALIEAWSAVDVQSRETAWDAARPFLTAADRKDLLTQVREELKHWTAGERAVESTSGGIRRRAGRALLDAAVGVIAQDRVTKHNFDVLYAPFQSALTGDPLKIARARASRAGATKAIASSEPQVAEPAEPAGEAASVPVSAAAQD